MKALAIKQPWASLIVSGTKRIENRTWPTRYRGPVLIHASKKKDDDELRAWLCFKKTRSFPTTGQTGLTWGQCPAGGIIGIADLIDCLTTSDDPWFTGPYGFLLANVRPLPFHPCRGALGLFDVPGYTPP